MRTHGTGRAFGLLLGAVTSIVSCGPPQRDAATADDAAMTATTSATATAPAAGPSAGWLLVAPMRIGDGGSQDLIVAADGTVTLSGDGRALGRVSPDGRFVDAQGLLRAVLQPDGTISDGEGSPMPLALAAGEALRGPMMPDREVRVRDDGAIVGIIYDAPQDQAPEVFGTVQPFTPEARSTALYLVAVGILVLELD